MSKIYRGALGSAGHRVFPSGVFLYQHSSGERVLFDTGYAPNMDGAGLLGKLYTKILPPTIQDDETIDAQLGRDGIDPASVGTVVLSHLHPDHIGGIRYFENARFVLSRAAVGALAEPRLRDGILQGLLPTWFKDAEILALGKPKLHETAVDQVNAVGYDLLGDRSYMIIDLPGHTRGHIGALVESSVLLAGDASWGKDLLSGADQLRPLPRFITYNSGAYTNTANYLQDLGDSGVKLCFSHDQYAEKELLG